MFYVYVIQNEKDKIYIGQTEDLEKRLARHNGTLKSKTSSFTNINKGQWDLVYKEICKSRAEAITREKQLKSYKGRQFIRSVITAR